VFVVVGELVRDLVQLAFAEPAQQARPRLRAAVTGDSPDHRHSQCQVSHPLQLPADLGGQLLRQQADLGSKQLARLVLFEPPTGTCTPPRSFASV
jgi:hypothetical protein